MNPLLLQALQSLFSYKKLFLLVMSVFLFVLSLPLLAILVLTNAGIPAVANTLVSVKQTTHTIAIHDPFGKVIATSNISSTWPIHGVVTLEFGASDLPYQPIHTGIDIAGTDGTPLTPFMQGTVSEVGHLTWGYGNYVVIDHGKNVTSLYGHMNHTAVTKGEHVQPGDVIGYEGQTGWATGPHVHFEVRVLGIPVNPRTFVQGDP